MKSERHLSPLTQSRATMPALACETERSPYSDIELIISSIVSVLYSVSSVLYTKDSVS